MNADLEIRDGSPLVGSAPRDSAVRFSGAKTPCHCSRPQSCCQIESRCGVWTRGYVTPLVTGMQERLPISRSAS